jgi:Lrp/AsnC family leucine-responsive transcriptional regulator
VALGLVVLIATYFSAFFVGGTQFTFANLVVRFVSMWRLIGVFLLGYILMVTANCMVFSQNGGLEAHDWKAVDLVIRVFHLYGIQVVSAATPIAWFVAVFAVFVPFGVTLHLMRRAADDDKFLRYSDGLIILVCSLTAILQLLPFPTFWFWNWSVVHRQVSGYLLGLFAIMNALTATFGFVVFCCVKLREMTRDTAHSFEEAARNMKEVAECYNISGEFDYLLKVYCPDMRSYKEFIMNVLGTTDTVGSIQSMFVMSPIKKTFGLSI